MFENLSKRFIGIFNRLSGVGKLRESNIEEAVRDVKLSLLESDVNYRVVGELVERIKSRAIGSKLLESLTPYQQFIGIVNEEIVGLLTSPEEDAGLKFSTDGVTRYLMVGLQGSGKTTTSGKLARHIFRTHGYRPLLVPLDTKRAAAIDQLKVIGEALEIEVFAKPGLVDPVLLAGEALKYAEEHNYKLVVFDTAGRLHIEDDLMAELERLRTLLEPQEVLLVADAMTGQDAVNVAKGFSERLPISGIILTKLDGDARGGAALSMVSVVKKPIKFIGTGEKMEALEPFHPDRIVSRILGMGDIVTLFEKTRETISEDEAQDIAKKLKKKDFTINDFREQLGQIRKLGSLEGILELIPGVSKLMKGKDLGMAEGEFKKVEAIISSMTLRERNNHAIINGRRRIRIAKGSGCSVQDINRFIKQFMQTRKMMQKFANMGPKGIFRKGLAQF